MLSDDVQAPPNKSSKKKPSTIRTSSIKLLKVDIIKKKNLVLGQYMC